MLTVHDLGNQFFDTIGPKFIFSDSPSVNFTIILDTRFFVQKLSVIQWFEYKRSIKRPMEKKATMEIKINGNYSLENYHIALVENHCSR